MNTTEIITGLELVRKLLEGECKPYYVLGDHHNNMVAATVEAAATSAVSAAIKELQKLDSAADGIQDPSRADAEHIDGMDSETKYWMQRALASETQAKRLEDKLKEVGERLAQYEEAEMEACEQPTKSWPLDSLQPSAPCNAMYSGPWPEERTAACKEAFRKAFDSTPMEKCLEAVPAFTSQDPDIAKIIYENLSSLYEWEEVKKAEITDDQIREVFLKAGFTIKPGQDDLKPYVFEAARALLALASQTNIQGN